MKTFKEIQKFRQTWLWLLLSGFLGLTGLILIIKSRSFDIYSCIPFLISIGVLVLFFKANLSIIINSDGIYYKFSPFNLRSKEIKWSDVKSYSIRSYNALLEYGGWGVRIKPKNKAYIVSGNKGLQIELNNGNKILLGTNMPNELQSFLNEEIKNSNTSNK